LFPIGFGYVVGVVELLVGISLFVGIWVRPACILGILFLLNMLLATWWETGPGSSGLALFPCRAGSFSALAAAGSVRGRCGTGLGAGPAPRIDFIAVAVKS
jgi:uncharacterized membrane protein YphA (DoxX/SURF4 family)